jgi:hypothetical protein
LNIDSDDDDDDDAADADDDDDDRCLFLDSTMEDTLACGDTRKAHDVDILLIDVTMMVSRIAINEDKELPVLATVDGVRIFIV